MTSRFLFCLVFIGTLAAPIVLKASSGGIIGRTANNGTGCGTSQCHGGAANANTTVAFEGLIDSTSVIAGSTTSFTVVVSHASAPAAGVNIAAKATETGGGLRAGTLLLVAGGHLQLLGGELTHFTPVPFESGTVRFMFQWVAPAEPGVYFLRAIANAVNLDGGRSTADQWNWAPVLRVRVVADVPNGVDDVDKNNPIAALAIFPVPAHDAITLTTAATPGSVYTVNVLDLTGTLVFSDEVTSPDNLLRYVWNGTTSAGIQALPGSYVVAVSGNGRVNRGRAVLVR